MHRPCKNSEKNPEVCDNFYTEVNSILKKVKGRHATIIAGDFNAKVGEIKDKTYSTTCGKYGKGKQNSNGIHLFVKFR